MQQGANCIKFPEVGSKFQIENSDQILTIFCNLYICLWQYRSRNGTNLLLSLTYPQKYIQQTYPQMKLNGVGLIPILCLFLLPLGHCNVKPTGFKSTNDPLIFNSQRNDKVFFPSIIKGINELDITARYQSKETDWLHMLEYNQMETAADFVAVILK